MPKFDDALGPAIQDYMAQMFVLVRAKDDEPLAGFARWMAHFYGKKDRPFTLIERSQPFITPRHGEEYLRMLEVMKRYTEPGVLILRAPIVDRVYEMFTNVVIRTPPDDPTQLALMLWVGQESPTEWIKCVVDYPEDATMSEADWKTLTKQNSDFFGSRTWPPREESV